MINHNYQVIKELGQGAQGAVFLVRKEGTEEQFAAKVYLKHDRYQLEQEILQKVKDSAGFPQIKDTIKIEDHDTIIMETLGENLRTLRDKYSGKLCLKTCLQIMHQSITLLQKLHDLGYVHCDLKPDNMLASLNKKDPLIYLVDFGLAHCYLDKNGRHIKQPEKINFKGSISYCSLNLLNKQYPSRRDDLESLIYVIMFLLSGKLPWHDGAQELRGQERLNYVIQLKQELHLKDYANEVPKSILKIYEDVRKLKFEQEPNYEVLRQYIEKDMKKEGFKFNGVYEWSENLQAFGPAITASQFLTPLRQDEIIRSIIQPCEEQKQMNESQSMEVNYKDLMSTEIDEGIDISIKELPTNKNDLSSLSPHSVGNKSDFSDGNNSISRLTYKYCENRRFKTFLSFNIQPFQVLDTSEEGDDGQQVNQDITLEELEEGLKTKRNNSFSITGELLHKIQKERKVSQMDLTQCMQH